MNLNAPSPLSEATSLHVAGKFEQAEKIYRELLENNESAVTHNNLAFLLSQLGRYEESVSEYRKAIEISPGYSTAYTNLGQTLLQLDRYEEGGQYLLKAVELDPDDFHANNGLAKFYMLNNNMQQAEDCLRRSYSIRPDGNILLDLAWCLLSQGRLQDAATILGYAEDVEKNNARYHTLWGLIHFTGNNFGQSIYCFRQSLGLDPGNVDTRNNLVAALLKVGSTEEAAAEMQRIILLDPGHMESLNNLAVLALASGDFDTAMVHLQKVIQKEPANDKAIFYQAMICLQKDRKQDATALFHRLAKDDQSDYSMKAKEALAFLNDNGTGSSNYE